VPDVLLATIELPDSLAVVGTGCLIQATVCRPKRDLRSESNAKEISDGLPFLGNFHFIIQLITSLINISSIKSFSFLFSDCILFPHYTHEEYELHRLLINKLKVKGMNAIFRLSVQVTVGDKIMSLIATGTAVFLAALHEPVVPKIVAGNSFNEPSEKLAELQKTIQATVEKNREIYQLNNPHHHHHTQEIINDVQKLNKNFSDTDDSDNEEKLDYGIGSKQTCILEIDDIQDLELFNMLMEHSSHDGINIVNAQNVPGSVGNLDNLRNFQMFAQGNDKLSN
jgi:hypothetical protein